VAAAGAREWVSIPRWPLVVLLKKLTLPGLLIKRLRSHIQPVWPDQGANLAVHPNLRELLRIAQRLEYPAPLLVLKSDIADSPVFEGETQLVVADDLDVGDVNQGRKLRHTS